MHQRLQNRKYLSVYILMAAFLFAMFSMVRELTRDDFYYQTFEIGSVEEFFDFLHMMYTEWSSRMVTEPLVVLLVKLDMTVWRVFCVVNILIIALSVRYLAGIRGGSIWKNAVICMLVGSFPFSYYASAGWVTTTAIYLISISLGMVALFPLRKFLDGKRSAWWENGLYILCAVLACNHEQVGAVVLGVYLCSFLHCAVCHRRVCGMQICQAAVAAADILFVLTCPGNDVRTASEIQTWLPEYADWTFFDKLIHGGFHAADYYFYTFGVNFVALALVCTLSLALLLRPVERWKKAVSLAVCAWAGLAEGILVLQRFHVLPEDTLFPWVEYGVNTLSGGADVARAVSAAVLLLLVFAELFWLFGNSLSFWASSMFLAAGFGSAAIMGFSPTIYASGNRVFSVFLYATILLIGYIVNRLFDDVCGKKEYAALWVTGIFSLASAAKNIWVVLGS